jgi:hypothetical protein
MRRFKRNAKNEEGRELIPAQKDGDGAMPEPSFEGVVSNRTFSRREAVGLTGAALAGVATLAATNANPAEAKSATISERDAVARKQGLQSSAKVWRFIGVFSSGQAAANFLNVAPAQVAGEMSATYLSDGRVALFAYF